MDVVSRAKNGVEIPGQKSTRNEIKYLFKDYLSQLKVQLNVSAFSNCFDCSHHLQGPTVPGKISLTCDAWQASNTDGVTGEGHKTQSVFMRRLSRVEIEGTG